MRRTLGWSGLTSLFWAGVWVLLDGQLTVGALSFALVLGVVTAHLARQGSDEPRGLFGAAWALVQLATIFLRELVISNLQQLRIVLRPRIDIEPRWIVVDTKLETDFGRALLAILVSMTPGTLSCEVTRSGLVVHVLDADDPQAAALAIQERFEFPILRLEQFRMNRWRSDSRKQTND